jgi:hypothetical protein
MLKPDGYEYVEQNISLTFRDSSILLILFFAILIFPKYNTNVAEAVFGTKELLFCITNYTCVITKNLWCVCVWYILQRTTY